MAVGIASAYAAELLDALFNSDAFDGPTNVYVKLHLGDPGAAGTANPAVETDRVEVTFGAASGGAIANDAAVEWTNVSTTETYTHFSMWTDPTAGSFLWSGTITGGGVTAGTDFRAEIGDLDVTLTNIAA
jgi:hypothetical protein